LKPQGKWYLLLWLSFILEAGSLTFLKTISGIYGSPLLFIIGAIGIVIAAMQLLRATPLPVLTNEPRVRQNEIIFIGYIVIFAALGFFGWLWLRSFFDDYPVDPSRSDIIPLIQKLNQRFASGEKVYEPVNDFGYTMYPNYLPATWWPFSVAEKLHLDYRTWTYIIMSTVLFLYGWFIYRSDRKLLLMLLSFATIALFLWYQPSTFGWTVEPMIVAFYLLLVLGIYLQRLWLIGLALVLCLLSRYAVVLWVPALFILAFAYLGKMKTIATAFLVVACIGLILWPFLQDSPHMLQNGYDYYTTSTLGEWKGQSWQSPGESPFQLSQGYGFAIWFYKWGKGDITQKLQLLKIVHFAICGLITLVSIIWYWQKGRKWLPLKWALLLSLHLYLVFFYAFIQMPYAYLFFTPLMVSMMIVLFVSFRTYPVMLKK
jgi:hypothetical protein